MQSDFSDETDEELLKWNEYILESVNEAYNTVYKLEKNYDDYDSNLIIPTTSDVVDTLKEIAKENELSLEQLCRDMIDFFILNTPD